MKRSIALVLALASLALGACGGASARAPAGDETTETWTSGDDEALGIEASAATTEDAPSDAPAATAEDAPSDAGER